MKILIVGYVWPEPSSTGAGLRMLELMHLFLAKNWQVTFVSPAVKTEFSLDLDVLGVQTASVAVNDQGFDVFIGNAQPDMVLFDRFLMEEQFAWRVALICPNALHVIETVDLHLLREARQQAHKEHRVLQNQDYHNAIALREIASIYRADLSLLISTTEIELLQNQFHISADLLHLCPFMVNHNSVHQDTASFAQRQHFMSIGNFRHAPNWDAVLWLKQEIWPRIRQQLPQAELHIYGAYTPPKATALHQKKDGFLIKNRADDVAQVMQQARLCLAPLRFGAGLKTKLVDAMRNGTPNITTSIGAEGMAGGLPWSGVIQDDAQSFADAAVRLYQQQEPWHIAQQHGYHIIEHHFNPETHGEALIQRLEYMMQHRMQHRQNNFIGRMLRHHHHRSTEFMSRWIESKNKHLVEGNDSAHP